MSNNLTFALDLAAAGLPVFRLKDSTDPKIAKTPFAKGWQAEATTDSAKVTELFSAGGYGVGIFTGSKDRPLLAVDVDRKHDVDGYRTLLGWELAGDDLPDTRTHTTLTGGSHLLFRVKEPVSPSVRKIGAGLDVRSKGSYLAASIGDQRYAIGNAPMADAPDWLVARCGEARERKSAVAAVPVAINQDSAQARALRYLAEDAPIAVKGNGGDQTTFGVAARVRDFGVEQQQCLDLMFEHWNPRCPPGWAYDKLAVKVSNAYAYAENVPGQAAPEAEFSPLAVATDEPEAMPMSEDSMAISFAVMREKDARYIAESGEWRIYRDKRWMVDKTLHVYDAVRRMVRASLEGAAPATRAKLSSAAAISAIERLARSDRRLAATIGQWDANPWLLNTPAGAIDLTTGKLLDAEREHYTTKMTAVAPGGDCPLWKAFLAKATAGDAELQIFIQKMAGYCLTGITREHAMFLLHGQGGNGKGVLMNTLTGVQGDYAKVAPVDTFTASVGERHPADMAMLQGARLVSAQETEQGRQFAEAKIKALTGGDPISARFMRGNFFTYQPQFKLVIAGNHKPELRHVDEAMRRRLHLIPFTVTVPAGERDEMLPEKLKAEWSGILAWAIEGCLLWQREGLRPPLAVRAATENYLAAEDAMGLWLAEECVVASDKWCSASGLFDSWHRWSVRTGDRFAKRKHFLAQLATKGFQEKREAGTGSRGFAGLALRPSSDALPASTATIFDR